MKNILMLLLTLGGVVLTPSQLRAQTDSLMQKDFDFLKASDLWLTGQNAAGLSRLSVSHLSAAQLRFSNHNGGFVNYYEAPKAFTVSAGVESFYRLNSRMVLYGQMRYDNIAGRHVAGSAFIDPTHMPFDIMEDSLTNTGRKHLDVYQLTGALSGKVWRDVSLGVKVDFTAANYAKYKDLRHKTNLTDIIATAGLYSPLGRSLQVGGNFFYRRSIESVRFATYGNADKVYKSFIDYGAFMGKIEQFGENGYTDQNRENPFFSERIGFGIQAEAQIAPMLTWYNEFGYSHRDGYFGKKSSYTVSYSQHSGNEWIYRSRLSWQQKNNRHDLNLTASGEKLENLSNNYRTMTDPVTSATYYEYLTPTKLGDKQWTEWQVDYQGNFGITELMPAWAVRAGVAFWQRKQTAFQHPYYRRQTLKHHKFFAEGLYNVRLKGGVLTAKAAFAYLKGNKMPYQDGLLATPSDKQSPPPTMEPYLWREYLWLTAPQYNISTALKYSFIPATWRMKTYVEAGFDFRKINASSSFLEGREHQTVQLTVGCLF